MLNRTRKYLKSLAIEGFKATLTILALYWAFLILDLEGAKHLLTFTFISGGLTVLEIIVWLVLAIISKND